MENDFLVTGIDFSKRALEQVEMFAHERGSDEGVLFVSGFGPNHTNDPENGSFVTYLFRKKNRVPEFLRLAKIQENEFF